MFWEKGIHVNIHVWVHFFVFKRLVVCACVVRVCMLRVSVYLCCCVRVTVDAPRID